MSPGATGAPSSGRSGVIWLIPGRLPSPGSPPPSKPANDTSSIDRMRPSGATRISTGGLTSSDEGASMPLNEALASVVVTEIVATPSWSTASTSHVTVCDMSSTRCIPAKPSGISPPNPLRARSPSIDCAIR